MRDGRLVDSPNCWRGATINLPSLQALRPWGLRASQPQCAAIVAWAPRCPSIGVRRLQDSGGGRRKGSLAIATALRVRGQGVLNDYISDIRTLCAWRPGALNRENTFFLL